MKDDKAFLVIGLGGCGGLVVNSIRESDAREITCLHLDWNSQIFNDFFYGYMFDVEKTIMNRIHSKQNDFLTVLDVVSSYHSLRELPDLFMRNTSRPLMRAALHLFWEELVNHLVDVIDTPTRVHIVCSTSGWTGSAWVLDIASMVRSILPNAQIEILLVIDFADEYQTKSMRMSSNYKTYWTLREFQACSDPSIKTTIEPNIEQAILSIMSSTEEHQNRKAAINICDLIATVSKEISTDHRSPQRSPHSFWRERSRPISDLVTDETKNLIAGYILAGAEGRSDKFREGSILNFSSLDDLEKHRITFMAVSGSEFSSLPILRGYGLAIIPYENWDEIQETAFLCLCGEGLLARTGKLSSLSNEAESTLISVKSDLLDSIEKFSNNPHDFHAKVYAGVLPLYVEIVDEILSSNS
jgi:hypothetical protein